MAIRDEKIIQVNYWKKLQKDLDEVVGKLHGVVLFIHNSAKFEDITDFFNKIHPDKRLRVLYISLINSNNHIERILKEKPLINKRLHVVDCVSSFIMDMEDTRFCVYRKPPQNLQALKEMILENIQKTDPNILVVDSLTQFINFSVPTENELVGLYHFLKELRENIIGLGDDSIILIYNDKVGYMKTLPVMNIDLILKYDVIRDIVRIRD